MHRYLHESHQLPNTFMNCKIICISWNSSWVQLFVCKTVRKRRNYHKVHPVIDPGVFATSGGHVKMVGSGFGWADERC